MVGSVVMGRSKMKVYSLTRRAGDRAVGDTGLELALHVAQAERPAGASAAEAIVGVAPAIGHAHAYD